MKRCLLVILGFGFMCITACNKSNDQNDQDNSTNNSRLLKKFRRVAGADTTYKYDYNYDSQNRISVAHSLSYEAGNPSRESTLSFYYNTNDSFPTSVRLDFTDHINSYSSVTNEYFTRDATGKLVKDSIDMGSNSSMVYHYEYFTDRVVLTTSFRDTVQSYITKLNGNIISEIDTIASIYIVDPNKFNTQVNFDNHPNPFYKIGIQRPTYNMPENFMDDDFMPALKNNMLEGTSIRTGYTSTTTIHVQIGYTYDTEGYPINMTETINGISTSGYYYY